MTVVVTGAAGHIGNNLIRSLLAQGRDVRALFHEDQRGVAGLDVEIHKTDICDPAALASALSGAEVVYHLAAHISLSKDEWPRLESVNVNGTRNVVQACLKQGVRRLIFFSSIHAMAQSHSIIPVDETCPLLTKEHVATYDISKALAESEVCKGIENGLDTIIISPTAIVGPYDYKPSHFGEALLRMACGKLPTLVTGGFDWVDVRDVVEGALRAEERGPGGAKYILSGHWVSLPDVARLVERITGMAAPRLVCPLWLARMGIHLINSLNGHMGKRLLYSSVSLQALRSHKHISHRKATRELEYHPRPFRETVFDTLKWFQENNRRGRPLNIPPAELL